jgi:large repetitive protein
MRLRMISIVVALAALPALAANLHLPGTITEEATGPAGAVVQYTATATGNDTGSGDDENGRPISTVTISCAPSSGSTFPLGATSVNCTASDATKGSFQVIVRDTTGPQVSHGGNITATATSNDGAVISSFNVSAHDIVDGARPVSCSPGPGLFPVGTTTVNCSASDSRGNGGATSFTVTVTAAPQPPPDLTVPNDMTVEANGPAGSVVTYSVSGRNGGGQDDENGRATGNVAVSCSPASGSTFPLGATTVTCTATSSSGTTSKSFTVTVVDTTAPALDIPRGFTVQAPTNAGAVVNYNASASDLVDGSVAINCSPATGSTFAIGTTTVSCSASDSRGNTASGSFDVTVTAPDAPPPDPELNLPDDITAEATGPQGAIVTFTATSGNGTGDDENGRPNGPTVTCAPASGSVFPLGTTTVQCSAGNQSGTFLVHIVDTTAPALSLPAGMVTSDTTVTWSASATDIVDGSVAVTCNPPSGSTFPVGTTTVNCSASDTRGNTATGSFDVTVNQQPGDRTITVSASPDKLWPPDHKMIDVTITVTTSDDTPVTAEIVNVASSETDPDDNTSPDWIVTGPLTLQLRAEKSAQAKVRIYTIDVKVTDQDNNLYLERATVTVTNANATSTSLSRSPRG